MITTLDGHLQSITPKDILGLDVNLDAFILSHLNKGLTIDYGLYSTIALPEEVNKKTYYAILPNSILEIPNVQITNDLNTFYGNLYKKFIGLKNEVPNGFTTEDWSENIGTLGTDVFFNDGVLEVSGRNDCTILHTLNDPKNLYYLSFELLNSFPTQRFLGFYYHPVNYLTKWLTAGVYSRFQNINGTSLYFYANHDGIKVANPIVSKIKNESSLINEIKVLKIQVS